MAKVRKTSSDSPRASAEPAVRIPISILVGSFDPAARTPELNEAEHRALVALRSDARRAEVGTEFVSPTVGRTSHPDAAGASRVERRYAFNGP